MSAERVARGRGRGWVASAMALGLVLAPWAPRAAALESPSCPDGSVLEGETCAPKVQLPRHFDAPYLGTLLSIEDGARTRSNITLSASGGGALAANYLTAVMMVFSTTNCAGSGSSTPISCSSYDRWLLLPLVGPWISLGERSGAGGKNELAFDILDGVGQIASLALMITGLVKRRAVVHRSLDVTDVPPKPQPAIRWSFKPWAAGKPGLTIVGKF